MVKFSIKGSTLTINKQATKLDEFALDAVNIIKKYTKYAIISGYISIFFGRARATEDIDMFIADLPYDKFLDMYNEFLANDFEFTIDNPHDLYYEYLKNQTPINIWRKGFPLLRMEVKIAEKQGQRVVLAHPLLIKFNGNEILFGSVESQIAYKRYIAKSEKDMEDARHLEIVFDGIDIEKIKYYRLLFEKEL